MENEKTITSSTDFESHEPLNETHIIASDSVSESSDVSYQHPKTPIIPKELYNNLPRVLKEGSELFKSEREKDVFLTSAITVLSGCFPTVTGIYDGKKVHANLYSFIIAPAASGKSAMSGAKDLGQKIHDSLVNGVDESLVLDESTGHKMLYIPGNISAAMIISILRDNNGIGIICESEADSLSNSFKQEWGGFSDTLRKAFHHEHISYARKQKRGEVIHIHRPQLSIALTGTPNQMPNMIKSIHDGLFSRFVFYTFQVSPVWRDPSPQSSVNVYETSIIGLQDYIKKLYDECQSKELTFDLTVIQWQKLNDLYSQKLQQMITFVSPETASSIFRMGLIHFRIAMLLTILRFFEENEKSEEPVITTELSCNDLDYDIAELLCRTYLEHGVFIYKAMTNQLESGLGSNIDKFYKALPVEAFKRGDAVKIGETFGFAERTVTKYLKILLQNKFLKQDVSQGPYSRVH